MSLNWENNSNVLPFDSKKFQREYEDFVAREELPTESRRIQQVYNPVHAKYDWSTGLAILSVIVACGIFWALVICASVGRLPQ